MELHTKNFITGEEKTSIISDKLKRLEVDPKFLFDLLYSNRTVFIYNELPEGCKFERAFYNEVEEKIYLLISNDSFEKIEEGAIVPLFEGEVLVKEIPEEKPEVDLKNEIKKGGKIKK